MLKLNQLDEKLWSTHPFDRNSKPFPGKYPTRWRATFTNTADTKCLYEYTGKPNRAVAEQIAKLIQRNLGILAMIEYDRGGVIAASHQICPRKNTAFTAVARNLRYFYYPTTTHMDMLHSWRKKVYSTKFHLGRHSWWAYTYLSTVPTEYNPRVGELEVYRQWLRKNKLFST